MNLINILFWNLNNSILYESIEELCVIYDVDILILCEYSKLDIEYLIRRLRNRDINFNIGNNICNGRVILFHRLGKQLRSIIDYRYYSGYKIIKDEDSFLLFGVHLPSKLRSQNVDQYSIATKCNREIQLKEQELGINKTIVIGDFNMNPFEDGMVSSDGFHGIMCPQEALKGNRIVYGDEKKFFYNPMWKYMGNATNNVMGTYYYNSGGVRNYYWNTFDQVLIRPSLIKNFKSENFKIIDYINENSLIKNNKPFKKKYSDHLPIFLRI